MGIIYLKGVGYCSLFVAGSPEPYDDNGNSPTLLNNNPLTSGDWLAIYLNYEEAITFTRYDFAADGSKCPRH